MDQKNLLTQALGFLQAQQRHRWWLRLMTGLAAAVVFATVYLLILPAITMENSIFEVTAAPSEVSLGETVYSEIYAVADDGREETFFVLSADGDNAGLDESRLAFDEDGVAVIRDEAGQTVALHREYTEDGEAHYWFVLSRGQSASFTLPWINGVDRYRTEKIEEKVPVQPEEEAEAPSAEDELVEEDPADSDGALPPETDAADQPSEEEPQLPAEEAPEPQLPAEEEPELSTVEEPVPDPEPSPAVEEHELEPASDAAGRETDLGGESQTEVETVVYTAVYTAASASALRYSGADSAQADDASAVLLSQSAAQRTARTAVTASASDAGETGEIEEETEYETIYHTEIVLERSGDQEQDGLLIITFGQGSSLEAALSQAGDAIELTWTEDAASQEEPEDAASQEDPEDAASQEDPEDTVSQEDPEDAASQEDPEDAVSQEIPEDATSWAIVDKEGFSAAASNGGSRSLPLWPRRAMIFPGISPP